MVYWQHSDAYMVWHSLVPTPRSTPSECEASLYYLSVFNSRFVRLTSSQEFRHPGAGQHCHCQIIKVGVGGTGGRCLQGWVTGVGVSFVTAFTGPEGTGLLWSKGAGPEVLATDVSLSISPWVSAMVFPITGARGEEVRSYLTVCFSSLLSATSLSCLASPAISLLCPGRARAHITKLCRAIGRKSKPLNQTDTAHMLSS